MNISADGGGICPASDKKFGNFTFSENLFHALQQYDTSNNYTIYTFPNCDLSQKNSQNITYQSLSPQKGWLKLRVSAAELLNAKDIFLATNQALPWKTIGKIITFSHGLSFLKFPKLYAKDLQRLHSQYKEYIKRSNFIIVSSERVKEEMIEFSPEIAHKIISIPFGIPFKFEEYQEQSREKFFIFSGMHHPIKNIQFIIDAFNIFKQDSQFKDYKLYLIGIDKTFATESICVIPHASHDELRSYFQKATAYLTASYYESFNFPALEALSQECAVIGTVSAIIPEMQEYVHIANNQEEFITKMKIIALEGSKLIDRKKLFQEFSWEHYVKQLVQLYNE